MAKVCTTSGCPELRPCPLHQVKPWTKRPGAPARLTGRRASVRNRRILKDHGGICHVCGGPGATEVDHPVPLAEGGVDDESNLAPIHPVPCHRVKTAAEAARGRRRAGRRA